MVKDHLAHATTPSCVNRLTRRCSRPREFLFPPLLVTAAAELFLVRPHIGRGPWSLTILRRFLSSIGGIQMTNLVVSKQVPTLIASASGLSEAGGNTRLKGMIGYLLESTMLLSE